MKRKRVTNSLFNLTTTSDSNSDVLFERKIEEVALGLIPYFHKLLYKISKGNAMTIINYITAMRTEVNLSDHYRRDIIKVLTNLVEYLAIRLKN